MTDKRLFLALAPLGLLAACGGDAPSDDERSASGEVLEGTISDAMLPVARVRSEPPLENPAAFARSQEEAGAVAAEPDGSEEEPAAGDADAGEAVEPSADEPSTEAEE